MADNRHGDIRDVAPHVGAITRVKTLEHYISNDLIIGSVATLPSDVKVLYPAFPSQIMKEYANYQEAYYLRSKLPKSSELWYERPTGNFVGQFMYAEVSDIYVDHHGNYYRGHMKKTFVKQHESMGDQFSDGRTAFPDPDSPFAKQLLPGHTYPVEVDEFFSITEPTPDELIEAKAHRQKALDDGWITKEHELLFEQPPEPLHCFLAGTEVDMWDGTTRPIEEINLNDLVVSYDDSGNLVPGRVTRTLVNEVRHILDLHGLMITPGHVTLCGDGEFAGQHVPIIDILRTDGALVEKNGSLVRAATGSPVGSIEDRKVWAVAGTKKGNKIEVADKGQIRLGTRFLTQDGRDLSVLDMIEEMGAVLNDAGMLVGKGDGARGFVFHWEHTPMLPKPEDYVLQRSELSLNDIYAINEWEAVGPQTPAPSLLGSADSLKIKM
ncbi:hypothetical protein [Denitrobaculum tricleocarpae]|uniref:Hint domain-containing protein n=1 Tax=Denitrobaculum tricleocarpae TaxID=2591009 RepID=A0A545TU36_9PROT|nr:hypothetical protein [Denitrobaculum tricleocarpae]TQV80735.1 hypothetical protein FKG95_11310 [Denitrobaculum tricleocarpae]